MRSGLHPGLAALAVLAAFFAWQTQSWQPSAGEAQPRWSQPEQPGLLPRNDQETDVPLEREYPQEFFADSGSALYFLCIGDPALTYEIAVESREAGDGGHRRDAESEPRPTNRHEAGAISSPESLPNGRPSDRLLTSSDIAGDLSALPDVDGPNRATRSFYLPAIGRREPSESGDLLESQLIAVSREARVYLERGTSLDQSFEGFLDSVCDTTDAVVAASASVGNQCRDVDADGKLSILLTSRLAQYGGGGGRLDGCVRWEDFQDLAPRSVGNAADVIFLNPGVPDRLQLSAVLAHEYGHLIAFTRRGIGIDPAAVPDEDWINEALAHVLEVRLSGQHSNLAGRIDEFLRHPERSPLVVANSAGSGLWRDPGSRGAGYLFLDWLVRSSPEDRLGRLLEGPERGTQLIETVAGQPFHSIWSRWAAELWSGGTPLEFPNTVRNYPTAIDVGANPLPYRIAVRGMSVCYLHSRQGRHVGSVTVRLPATAKWIEGSAHQRATEGKNPAVAGHAPQRRDSPTTGIRLEPRHPGAAERESLQRGASNRL